MNGAAVPVQKKEALSVDELETEPAVASSLFGAHIETARSFAREMASKGEELGLIGRSRPSVCGPATS